MCVIAGHLVFENNPDYSQDSRASEAIAYCSLDGEDLCGVGIYW